MSEETAPQQQTSQQVSQQLQPQEQDRTKKLMQKPKRRICHFCANKITYIDYKDVVRLKKYITETGKILPRRQTGLCAAHQREITNAIKRAQNMSLL
jgi:small subunit ribosomal protein S18